MMKVIMERALPAGFDVDDPEQVGQHCRIAVNAVALAQGKMHWLHSYITDDNRIFGIVVVEDQKTIDDWQRAAGIAGDIKVRIVKRELDPSLAK